ncbi:uncharacterized protein An07g05220 [Aspergillus niger]|uniref:Contig An07c0130, genomic contig n=2 Tax=Aspergillus niger TaxID=5061 RepID=A2QND2_ASPNC|nr:uncharacterized protein An07g05220 [Aspergillus niger]CAK39441.1 unnamed protein product [Aspergillus niger]
MTVDYGIVIVLSVNLQHDGAAGTTVPNRQAGCINPASCRHSIAKARFQLVFTTSQVRVVQFVSEGIRRQSLRASSQKMFCEEAPPVGSIAGKKGTVNHKLFSGSFRMIGEHFAKIVNQYGDRPAYASLLASSLCF